MKEAEKQRETAVKESSSIKSTLEMVKKERDNLDDRYTKLAENYAKAQNDKRTALAAKEAAEAALYGYQEANEENNTIMNKNNELLLKVSILECKIEERNDWKARYEDEERKSKALNLKLKKSNELFDFLSKQLGKEAAEMKKQARQASVKVPKMKKAQRR